MQNSKPQDDDLFTGYYSDSSLASNKSVDTEGTRELEIIPFNLDSGSDFDSEENFASINFEKENKELRANVLESLEITIEELDNMTLDKVNDQLQYTEADLRLLEQQLESYKNAAVVKQRRKSLSMDSSQIFPLNSFQASLARMYGVASKLDQNMKNPAMIKGSQQGPVEMFIGSYNAWCQRYKDDITSVTEKIQQMDDKVAPSSKNDAIKEEYRKLSEIVLVAESINQSLLNRTKSYAEIYDDCKRVSQIQYREYQEDNSDE